MWREYVTQTLKKSSKKSNYAQRIVSSERNNLWLSSCAGLVYIVHLKKWPLGVVLKYDQLTN